MGCIELSNSLDALSQDIALGYSTYVLEDMIMVMLSFNKNATQTFSAYHQNKFSYSKKLWKLVRISSLICT